MSVRQLPPKAPAQPAHQTTFLVVAGLAIAGLIWWKSKHTPAAAGANTSTVPPNMTPATSGAVLDPTAPQNVDSTAYQTIAPDMAALYGQMMQQAAQNNTYGQYVAPLINPAGGQYVMPQIVSPASAQPVPQPASLPSMNIGATVPLAPYPPSIIWPTSPTIQGA